VEDSHTSTDQASPRSVLQVIKQNSQKLPCQPAPSHTNHGSESLRLFVALQNVTLNSMADADKIQRGIKIWRKSNIQNDVRIKSCIERYDNGAYSRLQFLKAISHSLGDHTEAFQVTSEDESDRDTDATSPS